MEDGVQVLKTDPLPVEPRHVALKSKEKVLDNRVPEEYGKHEDRGNKEEKARPVFRQ